MGSLEAHVNGFRYETSSAQPHIDVAYENIKCAFFRAGDDKIPPLLHLHLHNQIILGTEETNNINFRSEATLVGQIDEGNKDLQDFVDKVTNMWDSKPILTNLFESSEYEFHGFFPTKVRAVFALTSRFLVELVETNPIVVKLDEIEIVNLAQLRPNEIDMTVVFGDFSRDVLEINSIPLESLAEIKHCLNYANVKYYQNERDLNWNEEVKKFRDSPQKFIMEGGWESLNLEAGDASDCFYWEEYGGLDEEDW
ncbi:FACT complex subunit SPT16-like isoform X3 [Papaver somniferum]|nr:FACT complex subunit SPT16-like isoform X3 [Papaver somniferum]